jgi:hypothetical protein
MTKKNRLYLYIFLIIGISSSSIADISDAALLYLRIAPGARAAGMGEAYVAIADDATSTHWNPAGLGMSPLASNWQSVDLPDKFKPITDVAAVKSRKTGGHIAYDLWSISNAGLVRYDNKQWFEYEEFTTKSTQTIRQLVSSYFHLTDEKSLDESVKKVARANNKDSFDVLVELKNQVLSRISNDYAEYDQIVIGFDSLLKSYDKCLVNWDQVEKIRENLDKGKADGTLTDIEYDRISFAIEKSTNRFIPEEIKIYYSDLFSGQLKDISAFDNYLVVATSDGLYSYDGIRWKSFRKEDGLISRKIYQLSESNNGIYVSTDNGLLRFVRNQLSSIGGIPSGEIKALDSNSDKEIYAVVENKLFKFNGTHWTNTTTYKSGFDETVLTVARRFAIYDNPEEISRLVKLIKDLNKFTDPNLPDTFKLTPGMEIIVPFCDGFLGNVTDIEIGIDSTIWVATDLGILYFNKKEWIMPGYVDVEVREGQTFENLLSQTSNSLEPSVYRSNIKQINNMTDDSVTADQILKLYDKPTAYPVNSITIKSGVSYFASDFGVFEYSGGVWRESEFNSVKNKEIIQLENKGIGLWYVATDKIYIRAKGRTDISLMFAKWLPDLADDIYYGFLSASTGIEGIGTIGGNITYITYGTVNRTDEFGNAIGTFEPYDIALTLSYGNQLNEKLKFGGSMKIIYSQLSTLGAGREKGAGTASGIGFDFGMMYQWDDRLNFGSAITNIGPDVSYVDAAQSDPLPRNLAIGFSYKALYSEYYHLLFTAEINKSLVSVDDGFDNEVKEIVYNGGTEFMYGNLIAFRAGYIYDQVGDVKTITLGLGLAPAQNFRFDFAYIPSNTEAPLANTLRVSAQILP